jgi:hypothetical protein
MAPSPATHARTCRNGLAKIGFLGSTSVSMRLLVLAALSVSVFGCHRDAPVMPATQQVTVHADPHGDLFYLDRCPVSGKLLGTEGDPAVRIYAGRHVRFGNAAHAAEFERDLAANLAKLDTVMIADQRPHYTLTTCIVTGKPLDGSSVEFVLFNRLFRVGDRDAEARVRADPARSFEKLDDAVREKQAPGYLIHKCPVQGTDLTKKSPNAFHDVVIANRLIRTCCTDCAATVRSLPSHYVPLIDTSQRVLRVK